MAKTNSSGNIIRFSDGYYPRDTNGIVFRVGETVYMKPSVLFRIEDYEPVTVSALHGSGGIVVVDSNGEELVMPNPRMLSHFDRDIDRDSFIESVLIYLDSIHQVMGDADMDIIERILKDATTFGYDYSDGLDRSLYPHRDDEEED